MVSFNVYRATSSGAYIEGVCLASDEKPIVGISNGSILYAVDASDGTTTRYMFDQSTASWIEAECPCSGGEGGGGEGGGVFVAQITSTDSGYALDKNYTEISEAMAAGKVCIAVQLSEGALASGLILGALVQKGSYIVPVFQLHGNATTTVAYVADSATGTLAYTDENLD